jgi:RNA recognition motif-containing protein
MFDGSMQFCQPKKPLQIHKSNRLLAKSWRPFLGKNMTSIESRRFKVLSSILIENKHEFTKIRDTVGIFMKMECMDYAGRINITGSSAQIAHSSTQINEILTRIIKNFRPGNEKLTVREINRRNDPHLTEYQKKSRSEKDKRYIASPETAKNYTFQAMSSGDKRHAIADVEHNIWVSNIHPMMDDKGLHDLFSCFGPVCAATVLKDKFTNESRCMGFVSFVKQESAENAVKTMHGYTGPGMGKKALMVFEKRVDETKKSTAPEVHRYLKNQKSQHIPRQAFETIEDNHGNNDTEPVSQYMILTPNQIKYFHKEKLNILEKTSDTRIHKFSQHWTVSGQKQCVIQCVRMMEHWLSKLDVNLGKICLGKLNKSQNVTPEHYNTNFDKNLSKPVRGNEFQQAWDNGYVSQPLERMETDKISGKIFGAAHKNLENKEITSSSIKVGTNEVTLTNELFPHNLKLNFRSTYQQQKKSNVLQTNIYYKRDNTTVGVIYANASLINMYSPKFHEFASYRVALPQELKPVSLFAIFAYCHGFEFSMPSSLDFLDTLTAAIYFEMTDLVALLKTANSIKSRSTHLNFNRGQLENVSAFAKRMLPISTYFECLLDSDAGDVSLGCVVLWIKLLVNYCC